MRIKFDKNLEKLAGYFGYEEADTFGFKLVKAFMDAGLLIDGPVNYGETMSVALKASCVSDVCNVIKDLTGNPCISSDAFETFCGLIVMGDGDCPECGGTMKYLETVGKELNDGDRFTPNSFVAEYDLFECVVCGYQDRDYV